MIASIILILFVTSLIAIIKTTFFKSNKSPQIKNSDNFIKQNQNNTFEKQSVNDNDMYLPINTLLQNGKYKIEKVLGNGTFGITYLATTKVKIGGQLGNMEATIKVAIKEFFMEAINGRTGTSVTSGNTDGTYDKYKKKFIKEARNMSKMNHPNIVKVSDIFEANNTCYYVMEYCEGGSLDELIKRKGCLSECESLNYIRQIATALKYMHDNKMLHLDLKPGNVVLRENGEAVLIDFGLSKQFDKSGKPETSTNIGLGTPGYAPIEQSNYDGTSFPVTMDVYALGGTWFKMLTGTCPPDASTILNQGFPAYELQNKNVSERSVRCIAKAMQPLYEDRTQSVGEFLKMLGGNATSSDNTIFEKGHKEGNNEGKNISEDIKETKPLNINNTKRKWRQYILLTLSLLLTTWCVFFFRPINYDGNYVDLGLSVKWGDCNVGANKSYEYGKYLRSSTALRKQNDTWVLPTEDQMLELINECTLEWTEYNSVKGMKIIGPNGNSIFLPAAGMRKSGRFDLVGSGAYITSKLCMKYDSGWVTDYMVFNENRCRWGNSFAPNQKFTVRPVSK